MTRDDIELNLEFYKARVKKNINLLFIDFISIFTNFDLKFKTFYDIKPKKKLTKNLTIFYFIFIHFSNK